MHRSRWVVFPCLVIVVLVAALLAFPHLLYALTAPVMVLLQGDTTVTVHDKTGAFGPIIDKVFPVAVAFLGSLVVKVAALINKGFAKSGELVKWIALYVIAMAFNLGARQLGVNELDPLAPVFGLGAVQTVAAALIFKFGQRRVPILEPSPVP